jgi:hypothetical protein
MIQLSDNNPTGTAVSYFRNVRVVNRKDKGRRPLANVGGGTRTPPRTPRGVPIYLLDYFGQKESADCGTCDVCRSSKKSSDTTLKEALVKFVNDEMSGSYTLEDVARRFGSQTSSDSDTYIRLLRRLIDDGALPAPGL